jgi:DNA-binding transcriptional ArsR family regulator
MNKSGATLECPECHGKGRVPLPHHLAVLLPILKNHPGATVEKIHSIQRDQVSPNAISNRLSDLMAMGFISRHREGKFFHYRLSSPKPASSGK